MKWNFPTVHEVLIYPFDCHYHDLMMKNIQIAIIPLTAKCNKD